METLLVGCCVTCQTDSREKDERISYRDYGYKAEKKISKKKFMVTLTNEQTTFHTTDI